MPSREELTPAERTQQAVVGERAGVVGRLESGACPFADSNLTFTLDKVDFAGLTAVPAERLDPVWRGMKGRQIQVSELCRIRDRAAEALLNAGYLARVEIVPQEITGGRVTLQVIEAHIAAVEVTGSGGAAQAKVADYLAPLKGLAPFDLDAVQRQIMLAADVPGVRLSSNVRPSTSGESGAVDLVVSVEHDPVSFLAGVQNYGASSAGPWTLFARADVNSLTSLGERTSIIVSTTSDFEEQRVLQLLEEVRLGSRGLLARGSLAFAQGEPGGALESLGLATDSFVASAELAYPFLRHRRYNLWGAAGAELVDQSTDVFAGASRLINDNLRVGFVRFDADQRERLTNGLLLQGSAGLELRKGLDVFGASDRGEPLLSRAAANPRAWVVRARGQGEFALPQGVSLATAFIGQWADDPLLAYEELSIGNYTIGRGYDPGLVTGDRAAAASLELRYQLAPADNFGARLFAFYDAAWVDNLDAGPGSGEHTVSSLGGGVRLDLGGTVGLDLTYAHPLDAPIGGGPKPDDRLLVQLIARIR